MSPLEKELRALSQKLTDNGQLIEAGWVGLRIMAIDHRAPDDQIREMRMAYMAGAQHLFSSIMSILEDGDDATDADMRRMALIDQELRAFAKSLRHWKAH